MFLYVEFTIHNPVLMNWHPVIEFVFCYLHKHVFLHFYNSILSNSILRLSCVKCTMAFPNLRTAIFFETLYLP